MSQDCIVWENICHFSSNKEMRTGLEELLNLDFSDNVCFLSQHMLVRPLSALTNSAQKYINSFEEFLKCQGHT
uniref:Uncharacterized protein n=1 Tax=Arion vulgaris TaxID=1028688 RepID=A0A0B7AL07_9EUPU